VIGAEPVLLIVMETRPPPFHEEETAKEVPALQVPVAPLEGVGVTPPPLLLLLLLLPEELLVDVEVEVAEEALEDEDEEELELAAELEELEDEAELAELETTATEDPELQFWPVAHWQEAALEQVGEPPPPQGTWR
jgi:hypothetical protein